MDEPKFDRITIRQNQMGGVPCIRGLRIPVATVVGMVADGMSDAEILAAYPDLEADDIRASLRFAAEAVQETRVAGGPRMKLLINNALSPRVAEGLRAGGCDAIHVSNLGMAKSDDEEIFQWCLANGYVIVSADTDFGTLLAQAREKKPSVLLLRRISQRRPEAQVAILLANLPRLVEALDAGSVVVIEENRIRIRSLPIIGPSFFRRQKPK